MLTREESKEFLPIIQAFAEGKTIQVQENDGYWRDLDVLQFNYDTYRYRIKPELKYRSFKDTNECWKEMQKHQPFGWLRARHGNQFNYFCLNEIRDEDGFDFDFNNHTFADGAPFGVKEL